MAIIAFYNVWLVWLWLAMGVLSVLELQVANMWELHLEIEDCSATNLSHITTFELTSRVGFIGTL